MPIPFSMQINNQSTTTSIGNNIPTTNLYNITGGYNKLITN
jgi:hypothetical protein